LTTQELIFAPPCIVVILVAVAASLTSLPHYRLAITIENLLFTTM